MTGNLSETRAALRREIGPPTERDAKWQAMVSAGELRLLLDGLDAADEQCAALVRHIAALRASADLLPRPVDFRPTIADVATYLEVKASNFEGASMADAAIDVRMIADGVFDPREGMTAELRAEAVRQLARAVDVPVWLLDTSIRPPWHARLRTWLRQVVRR